MARTIKDFKSFEEAEADEISIALSRTPAKRVMLLHKLIHAWMKFPRPASPDDENIPTLKRIKN
jgi:hypothetical protein